ncbi:sensor histidine kinase [Algibacillus agarilyticus]|uniref:sensor histidine kinase n=1 Tax=Algibacillus agarilyticus TaxID=2234133 RepID=UPI000DD02E31|nr:HAMP domain-containing sensor histidine kinase [Algibacillus agarilyticus]
MKLSIFQKLALFVITVFIFMGSIFFVWNQHVSQAVKAEGEQKLHLGLAEHLVHDNPLLHQGVYDKAALENLFHTLMVLGPNFEFYFINPQGQILTYSAEPGKVKRDRINLEPLLALHQSANELPILGDDPRHETRQKIFSVAPIYLDDQARQTLQGYLYVIIGGEIHDNIFSQLESSYAFKSGIGIALISFGILLVLALIWLNYFIKPLQQLTHAVSTFDPSNDNNLAYRLGQLTVHDKSEIGHLTSVYKQMAERIQNQVNQLQNLDSHRRELLADLSHDLRTPLASLQGYIETISLQGEALNENERQRFIDISLKNAQALRKLIDQIFELAYLEGGQVKVAFEALPLGELLHDVVAKFALTAQAKNIQISVQPAQFNFQVYTDIAKLERILTNIIDNAIRHTPEHGQISIQVTEVTGQGQSQLKIDIVDTGIGISEQDIAYIFDARYRASNTQGKKDHNAGLGLAITKKLVNLLNSDIAVSSEPGQGTCFSFYLQQA